MQAKTWHAEIYLTEDGPRTRAEAVLRTDAGTEVREVGLARRSPRDPDAPEIGDELAVARALTALGHALFEASVMDVEQNTGEETTFAG